MKALVISPQPFFSPRGTPFSVYYRTSVLAKQGVEIDLLTYGEGVDVDIPNVRIIRIPRFKFLGNVKIGPSKLKLFLDFFIIIWTVFLLIRNKYDFVHAHEEAIFFCIFLKPIFRFKLIYDMHSSLPQQLSNFQFTKLKSIILLFKKLEDKSIETAEAVITICPDLADYVNSIIKDKQKHLLIENSIFDPVKLKNNKNNTSLNSQNHSPIEIPKGAIPIVYAGTLEKYQGIDILIKSIKFVIEKIPNIFLIIVGGSPNQVEHFSKLANDEGVDKQLIFTGRVDQASAKYYCQLASLQLSPRSAGTNTPLKVYEQLSSGIPIVATKIYSHTQVLDNNVAFLVEPEPIDMARGIVEAIQNPKKAKEITANAKELYKQKYGRSVYEKKMLKVLQLVS